MFKYDILERRSIAFPTDLVEQDAALGFAQSLLTQGNRQYRYPVSWYS